VVSPAVPFAGSEIPRHRDAFEMRTPAAISMPVKAAGELAALVRVDELFTAWPFLGSRRMAKMLQGEGRAINRKRIRRLMRKMGIAALGPKPRTSKLIGMCLCDTVCAPKADCFKDRPIVVAGYCTVI
jgi:hypothetical protein